MSTNTQQRATAWLSEGFECLVQRLQGSPARPDLDFDVIVVGSGYGGAIAASSLAGRRNASGRATSVCVLERGKEYLPGAFPTRMADLAGHTRFSTEGTVGPRGKREGLLDVKVGSDVSALVANGLGGGSLINAGVMLEPPPAVRATLEALTGPLSDYYARARVLLGAEANTILDHESAPAPLKYTALKQMAQRLGRDDGFGAAPITVAMRSRPNAAGIALDACRLCGDCATGCNFNAKDSLDTNLLVMAKRRGAQLFTGATVVRIERDEPGARWRLQVAYTDETLRKRMPEGFTLFAGKLILAAGTYGSTEILMRSRSATLTFSPMLGQRFSSNGDMIALAYNGQQEVNAVADEDVAPGERKVGPTITGMIRVPDPEGELVVEELAVPGPLRRLFEEIFSTAWTLHQLGRADRGVHGPHDAGHDPCAVDGRALRHSAVLAVMGDDGAAGQMKLVGDASEPEGGIQVCWPELRHHRLFQRQAALLAKGGAAGGTILPNPMWKLLPDDMAYLVGGRRGPLLTVHPLGGCPIGANAAQGVVNAYGQVYRDAPAGQGAVHASLVVLDGAIVPAALGVNPALTIAALALHAVENLRREWTLGEAPADTALPPRPVFQAAPETTIKAAPTQVQFVERLAGPATLKDRSGVLQECMIEMTLRFAPGSLGPMVLPGDDLRVPLRRVLQLGADSTLALYSLKAWQDWRRVREGATDPKPEPLLQATLTGTLDFFHREESTHLQRVLRTLGPWLRNRGLRDTWQWRFGPKEQGDRGTGAASQSLGGRVRSALALASRAGEVRRFDYALTISEVRSADGRPGPAPFDPAHFDPAQFEQAVIAGEKRLTYAYAANPWSQLMRMTLTRFPGLVQGAAPPVLELDTGFLVREAIPLMRITGQQDQPTALADVAGLAGYLLRLLLSIHMWSFRKPDTPPPRVPQRLPPPLPGLRMERCSLPFPDLADGTQVAALLTRYRADNMNPALPPILMIHGYSASGTTFAHAAVNPNLVSYMCARGRDAWVLDMRTSSGMPTATHPWSFEDAAHNDIPVAVARICRATGHEKIDVVAHCMGAAMFAMAVLGEPRVGDPCLDDRLALPGRVNRLLLSQVGPLVVFSQANIFRAYVMGFVRHLLPGVEFPFTVEGESGMADELIDRLLATIPYPDQEFKIENPAWPWQRANFAGTRHRMDALYGRDFELANIDAAVLDRIDDFFGPYNLVTLNQAIHFTRLKTITNRAGRNPYVSRKRLKENWKFPTHSIHGVENGLSDVSTLERMASVLGDAGCPFTHTAFEGFGHQDCFIGRGAVKVFDEIARFFDSNGVPRPTPAAGVATSQEAPPEPQPMQFIARVPWTGPMRSGQAHAPGVTGSGRIPIGAAASPVMHQADFVALVPVLLQAGRYTLFNPSGATDPRQVLINNVELFTTENSYDEDGWVQLSARTTPDGADGVMMLMIYDAAGTLEPPSRDALIPLSGELMERMQHFDPHLEAASELLNWIFFSLTGPVYQAIDAALTNTAAQELQSAVITCREQASAPSVRQPARAGVAASAQQVCFAVASCQYPAGMLDSEPAFASFARLSKRLDSTSPAPTPSFIALLGDQIYADATAGLFDPTALDDRYFRPYEKLLGNVHVKDVLRRLPAVTMLDDHEIEDNWEPGKGAAAGEAEANLEHGVRAYLKFQRTADLMPDGADRPVQAGEPLAYAFKAGGLPFYMADTRTGRAARTPANIDTATIMPEDQFKRMTDWLSEQNAAAPDAPKFLAAPSIVAPGRLGPPENAPSAHRLRYDGWAGYPASLHRLLAYIADGAINNVVLLSGDEHISCDAVITISTALAAPVSIRAIHSSALYAPYPFANSRLADMADEHYEFGFDGADGTGKRYQCAVRTRYVAGDGYAVVTATLHPQGWDIACEFDRAS